MLVQENRIGTFKNLALNILKKMVFIFSGKAGITLSIPMEKKLFPLKDTVLLIK